MKWDDGSFLRQAVTVAGLRKRRVLEIGCGTGERTVELYSLVGKLSAVEPSPVALMQARNRLALRHVDLREGSAEDLPFLDQSFDAAIFMLSFHHVPAEKQRTAIDEAIRVTRAKGQVIFIEPTVDADSSFYEAEKDFDAGDGDERMAKALALVSMLNHERLEQVTELFGETIFNFSSVNDFITAQHPRSFDIDAVASFLAESEYTLRARRRINIFRVRQPQAAGVADERDEDGVLNHEKD